MLRSGILAATRLALLAVALAFPAKAYVIQQNVQLSFEAGSFCNSPDDGKMPAPDTRDGEVGIHNQPYQFILLGDKAPALPDLAIGLILHLKSFTPGETLTIRQFRFEDMDKPDTWPHVLAEDGRLWIGTKPDPGKSLPYGLYQTAVLRGTQTLFVFEFQVVPASMVPELRRNCTPAVS